MSQNGKGSRLRPKSIDQKTWTANSGFHRILHDQSIGIIFNRKKTVDSGELNVLK